MTTIRVYEDEDEHKRKDIYQHEMEELVMDRARGFPGGEEEVENEDHQLGYREKLAIVLNSYRFHIAILFLVAFDCLLVFGALIIDLRLFTTAQAHCNSTENKEPEDHHNLETIEKVLHFTSIFILGLFVLEVILKLVAFGYHFFSRFEELIDAIIILVSFALDIVFINNEFLKFMGVLIFLRLWRVVRIVHAIITAVMTPMEHKIEQEEKKREIAEHRLKEALYEIELLNSKLLAYQHLEEVEKSNNNSPPLDGV